MLGVISDWIFNIAWMVTVWSYCQRVVLTVATISECAYFARLLADIVNKKMGIEAMLEGWFLQHFKVEVWSVEWWWE